MKLQNKPAHIGCAKEDIASIVLMPGDPLRAKYIAEKFLTDARLITSIRNMYGFTGFYKGKKVTVMGSGMGIPSMGIYGYELYKFYDVEKIIRIGSCGNLIDPNTKLLDVIIADKAYSESNYAFQFYKDPSHVIEAQGKLTNHVCEVADKLNVPYKKGTINTTEVFDFYIDDLDDFVNRMPKDLNIVACEMEAYALFHLAKYFKKDAACLATVVDSHFEDRFISPEDRETSLNEMIMLALESII